MIYVEYAILFCLVLFVIYGFIKILPAPLKELPHREADTGYSSFDSLGRSLYFASHIRSVRGPQIVFLPFILLLTVSCILFAKTRVQFKNNNDTIRMLRSENDSLETQAAAATQHNVVAQRDIALLKSQVDSLKFELEYSRFYDRVESIKGNDIALAVGQTIFEVVSKTLPHNASNFPFFRCISIGVKEIKNDSLALFNINDQLSGREYQIELVPHRPFVQRETNYAVCIEVLKIDVATQTVVLIPQIKSHLPPKNCNK